MLRVCRTSPVAEQKQLLAAPKSVYQHLGDMGDQSHCRFLA
ncbi:hypothetical protein SBA2_260097 [Acidobacteriia bacterium SbA2]|nr:hypothetical protein SBA2_260097 [Acidobacteriia bacterium SbA2]